MKKNIAIYAGTFDPFTNGHLNIVQRGLNIFEEIRILVAVSPNKKPMFSTQQRIEMIKDVFKNNSKVTVDSWAGLLVEYAEKNNIKCLLRGLRPTGDFESEFQMASMNNHLNSEIETVFLMTSGDQYFVSSSLVKEIHQHGKDITAFVPTEIINKIKSLKK